MTKFFMDFSETFTRCFITNNGWRSLLKGFIASIEITVFAVIVGFVFGIILAIIRSSYDKNEETLKLRGGIGYHILKFFNALAKIYITIVRGVPVVVQLLIWCFVIFASSPTEMSVFIAIIAFGFNSAAYVAEIFRGGIMAIDQGQFEAGRSLGLNYFQTMVSVIIPQAFKNVLPALLNEIVALLKETSIAGYVGIEDLTKKGEIIQGITFEAFMPYLAVAVIYLVTVLVLTRLFGLVERRLRKSER